MSDRWPDIPRWSEAELVALARSAVNKVDLLGLRGTTLVSMDEVAAMAGVIAAACVLPPIEAAAAPEPVFTTRRKK